VGGRGRMGEMARGDMGRMEDKKEWWTWIVGGTANPVPRRGWRHVPPLSIH